MGNKEDKRVAFVFQRGHSFFAVDMQRFSSPHESQAGSCSFIKRVHAYERRYPSLESARRGLVSKRYSEQFSLGM